MFSIRFQEADEREQMNALYMRNIGAGACPLCAMGFAIAELEHEATKKFGTPVTKFEHNRPPMCRGGRRDGSTCRERAIAAATAAWRAEAA